MSPEIERIPAEEAEQIANIVQLTVQQVRNRCPGELPNVRGVHVKDHGCVKATFTVRHDLPESYRVGLFADAGHEYKAWIRFSNAAANDGPDSPPAPGGGFMHGSRGMAVKVMGITGTPLLPANGPLTQDFLMVNHPVFPFPNVADYEALSKVLAETPPNPMAFFTRAPKGPDGKPDPKDPVTQRTATSFGIVQRIQSLATNAKVPAYQDPPPSPFDNQYFGAAAFLFGPDKVMRFTAKPVSPQSSTTMDFAEKGYLRKALHERLTAPGATDIVFEFQLQVRDVTDIHDIDKEIENVCYDWDEQTYKFETVAEIRIPPQDTETTERKAFCESLSFTPWHGLAEHRPLGGINRMRRAVYEASSAFRHIPKEPAGWA